MVVMLTTSKNILWLKIVTSISKIIFNQPLLNESFLLFSFFVQNFLFHGYVHGSMIIIYKTDIQYLFANLKSNVSWVCSWFYGYVQNQMFQKFSSLLIFCTKFFVSWVCSWFYDYNIQNGHPVLVRKFKIKWWDSFAAESKSSKLAVTYRHTHTHVCVRVCMCCKLNIILFKFLLKF
jgi:hypothetical protein